MEVFKGAAQKGLEKGSETLTNKAVSFVVDSVKKMFGEAQVRIGTVFDLYLSNAARRLNCIRTITTGVDPRLILGENSLYENVGVLYRGDEVDTSTVNPLLRISNNILILGTGGAGKSMLMRYLFLITERRGDFIPIFLDLRRISDCSIDTISIEGMIFSCLKEYDARLPEEQFVYSLRLGKYLFLLDGFDEIKESHSTEAAKKIQGFVAKYPNNPCILTSRPIQDTLNPLETFTIVETMPLSCDQAVHLASKIWEEDEKTREFCKQLRETLYEKHKDFAENPLLLSMMFLTFMDNNSIPDHLSDFYRKCYEALYSKHDNKNKGYYKRDFKCASIDEGGFKRIFSRFCFQSYFDEKYEFSEAEIVGYLKNTFGYFGYDTHFVNDYLSDLRNAVCLIVREGDIYKFSHRSFQEYFAAYYTARYLNDNEQIRLFNLILTEENARQFMKFDSSISSVKDYYKLLIQIEPEKFATNALKEEIKKMVVQAKSSEAPDRKLLLILFCGISFDRYYYMRYNRNYAIHRALFLIYAKHVGKYYFVPDSEGHHSYNEKVVKLYKRLTISESVVGYKLFFDDTEWQPHSEYIDIVNTLVQEWGIKELYQAMDQWLKDLDKKERALHKPNFIDEL